MLADRFDYILMIAQERNMTRAAKKLYVSQPALTTHLNRLEETLGVKLFDRSQNPITITEAGAYYIEHMKRITASEEVLRNDLKKIAEPKKTLVIGIGNVRGDHWCPMFLPKFCENHPDLNVQIVQTLEQYMLEDLTKGKIDVAFGSLPIATPNVITVQLLYEKLFFAVHKKYLLLPNDVKNTSPLHPCQIDAQKLQGLPFIYPNVGNGLYQSLNGILSVNHITPGRLITINNMETGLKLTRQGLGVQLLSGSILQAFLDYSKLFAFSDNAGNPDDHLPYSDDRSDNTNSDTDGGNTLNSGADNGNSVNSGADNGNSVNSGSDNGNSVNSGANDGNSVNSGANDGNSVNSGANDGNSVNSGANDGNSVNSGAKLRRNNRFLDDAFYQQQFPNLDFFVVENMPSDRSCVAAFVPKSPKKQIIWELIYTINSEVIPNCSLTHRPAFKKTST